MLIELEKLIKKFDLKIKGVLHIGAHTCEEYKYYKKAGLNESNMIWVEGNPEIYNKLKALYPKRMIYHCVASNEDNKDVMFYVANNGQSSSILELGTHKKHHPYVRYVKSIKQKTKTIKTLYKENNINVKLANFLNIDIQGAELLALKGMGDLLKNFEYLYLEVNNEKIYKDCALIGEIDNYVKNYGFERVATSMTRFNWGDALYIKKK